MATLLRIDSSPLGGNASVSRQLTAEFVRQWQQAHPDGKVITRDLTITELPLITADWIEAAFSPEAGLNQLQKEILTKSSELIDELYAADEYVVGVPMYNFSVPAVLKLWIDQITRAGKTFSYEGGKLAGLLLNKKVTFLIASGGVYDPGTPGASMNFVEPYLRSLFAFIGVTDTSFITASGTAMLRYGIDRESLLRPALTSIREQFVHEAQVAA